MHLIIYIIIFFSRHEPFSISAIFANNNFIPVNYSCSGANVNPELRIKGIPQNTKTLALVMEDPDPAFGTFDHWVMWNIPPQNIIAEDSTPGIVGTNSRKQNKYTGPCPPSGVHRYNFKIYALNTSLNLSDTSGKRTLMAAMKGHILAEAELVGLFNK
jgi:Raf kinase inhibitor-like YbhB/YbcL family protein